MMQKIGLITLVVPDYDEAIAYYTQKLGFLLHEDTRLSPNKRWVVVRPPGACETGLLLAKADGDDQIAAIGKQTGGRVFMFLQTDDFVRDYAAYKARGVQFLEEPRDEPYGTVTVFADLYGNKWDLIELRDS
jgi:catechol 2,3-dioxygenase-like lactoylglutathione lyase family enzyme